MILGFLFALSAATTLLVTPLFPVQFFFPFMALSALRLSHAKALWISVLCGLFLDLLSSESSFGLHSFIFVLTMLLLYPYRRFFFEEKWLPFTFFALLFSSLNSLFLAVAASIMRQNLNWSVGFIAIDLFLLPVCDAICGYLLLIAPKLIVRFFKRTLLQWRWRAS